MSCASDGVSGFFCRTRRISGARQNLVPTAVEEISKSAMTMSTLVDAESTTKMLAAFRSLCMMPCACKRRIPSAICAIRDKIVVAENGFTCDVPALLPMAVLFRSMRKRRSHSYRSMTSNVAESPLSRFTYPWSRQRLPPLSFRISSGQRSMCVLNFLTATLMAPLPGTAAPAPLCQRPSKIVACPPSPIFSPMVNIEESIILHGIYVNTFAMQPCSTSKATFGEKGARLQMSVASRY